MAKDMRMLETKSSIGIIDENVEEENELMLELSIGGIFGNSNRNESREKEASKVVESKREIEAFRRGELRKKREEKLKKSGGSCGSVSGPFEEWIDDEAYLETEPARKKERIGNSPGNNGIVNHKVMPVEGGGGGNRNVNSDGCCSSAFSDSQCSSRQGGATDDSRSNSTNSQVDQQVPATSAASHPSGQPTESSIPKVSTNKLTDSTLCNPGPSRPNYQFNSPDSSLSNLPSNLHPATQQAAFLARMPCVSTTGNGPNGRTVSGFLYRYTKNEVSIMCGCHGRSFSPAGFVEHAGGVDIIHPLKHITIFPTAFAS